MPEPSKIFAKDSITRKELFHIKKSVSRNDFTAWLKNNFQAIRCYHASRPTDLTSYFLHGLRPSDLNQSLASFHQLLKEVNYSGDVNVQETMELFQGKSDRFIYVILDKYDFIDHALI
ncbi:hypothetical protein ACFGVS_03120 [Mucilaginibacter sp. AW1-7]|uniref:hypothetical protein n=1 Tax=Mucilaginibacter sp. AW1-7 TaxID=3349874 RepID=UPI003F73A642